jgi:microcystin-dependent protein
MSCNNCYNGCVETTSDKCVRYTGNNVEDLSIETGDSLYVVEQALIDAVVSFLDGTGIDITINPSAYCALVTSYLPECKPVCAPPTAVELFEALVKAACDLQTQVTAVNATLATLNADYTIDCLTGVTASSDTHAIVQAVINKLCDLGVDLAALALDVDTNYVKLSDLDALIQAYLDTTSGASEYYTKMVPYTAVEFYGTLTGKFDITGAGTGDWINIYLCNGQNGTPDKRGRVPVGAIQLVPGGALNAAVNTATPGNPNYALGDVYGANTITLDATQIPSHTHIATPIVTDTHRHFIAANIAEAVSNLANSTTPIVRTSNEGTYAEYSLRANTTGLDATVGRTSQASSGAIDVDVSNANTGGDLAHSNIQPVLACYYIMYIP